MKIKTKFDFDSAHRLVGYDGKCSNLHGHMWVVEIEVEGDKLDEVGILWDFTNAKSLAKLFDHKTILKICKENQDLVYTITKTCGSEALYMMKENPTAEHLAELMLTYCKENFPDLKFKIKVWESPKSSAEVKG